MARKGGKMVIYESQILGLTLYFKNNNRDSIHNLNKSIVLQKFNDYYFHSLIEICLCLEFSYFLDNLRSYTEKTKYAVHIF